MLPSLFISHGSPMLALEPGASGPALSRLANTLPRPRSILIMSAHWESEALAVSTAAMPRVWHDFRGFPPALHALDYPAAGDPALAARTLELLAEAGLEAIPDDTRPRDHGAWVPMRLMYPLADIPVLQVSLPSHLSPAEILRIGAALKPLRAEGVLLVGSGSITHNLRELDWNDSTGQQVPEWAQTFRNWIVDKLQSNDLPDLVDYRQRAPHAARNHPSDEHLLPLYFARGAGERPSIVHEGFDLGSLGMDIYRFD